MASDTILLGYTIRIGQAVNIPLRHWAVNGQTQDSGKATTFQALVATPGPQ